MHPADTKPLKIFITGANGESIPPPFGGIMKRCLLHAKEWRAREGAQVFVHVHHKHNKEQDLGAQATYVYDFHHPPTLETRIAFLLHHLSRHPILFTRLLIINLRLSRESVGNSLYYTARGVFLDQCIIRHKPDVLVTETGSAQSLMALEVAKRHRLPIVLENYAEIQFKANEAGENIASSFAPLWQELLHGVDLVVPASKHCAKGPLAYLPPSPKIQVVYSGINFEIFHGRHDRNKTEERKKFDLPADKFLIMAVGALKMRKGHDQLFECILQLTAEERKDIMVVLCGMGSAQDVQDKAAELGFPKESLRIFQGLPEETLADLYGCMNCFCFPSITPRECMGMAMKEAMSVGLPVAAYDAGGIKEAIEEGVNGFLAPVGDRAALAECLRKIRGLSPEAYQTMCAHNIEKAQSLFDIRLTAHQLYEKIADLVQNNP